VTKCYTLITSTLFSYPIFIHDTRLSHPINISTQHLIKISNPFRICVLLLGRKTVGALLCLKRFKQRLFQASCFRCSIQTIIK